jgi:DNA-binding transcriptional ArsR family regulator
MRPLFHPSIEDVTVEGILHALSDPVRVAIYADIVSSDCSYNCSTFLSVREQKISKSTLSQHFKALGEAGLIRGERRGVRNAEQFAVPGNRNPLPRINSGNRQRLPSPIRRSTLYAQNSIGLSFKEFQARIKAQLPAFAHYSLNTEFPEPGPFLS